MQFYRKFVNITAKNRQEQILLSLNWVCFCFMCCFQIYQLVYSHFLQIFKLNHLITNKIWLTDMKTVRLTSLYTMNFILFIFFKVWDLFQPIPISLSVSSEKPQVEKNMRKVKKVIVKNANILIQKQIKLWIKLMYRQ